MTDSQILNRARDHFATIVEKQLQRVEQPNLYGNILTDEAAQIQGDVGTAGSASLEFGDYLIRTVEDPSLESQ